jgi:D-3-phosphoglycerate dehydrogenase
MIGNLAPVGCAPWRGLVHWRRVSVASKPPIVLFVDRGFDAAPFRSALEPELTCRERLQDGEAPRVLGMVTGAVPIGAAAVAPFPALRIVVTCSIGTDHLDLPALAARGIAVCNTPSYCTEEVADHALACVLAGWRGLDSLHASVRAGRWDHSAAGTLRRFDASRLAIVGYGRIGRALARKARALGIDVVAHDPFIAPETADIPLCELDEALASADAVSLHAPGVPGRPPILGAPQLERMVRGAVLVNLARSSLVDVDAMVSALRAGRLASAYWDVWPREPPATDDARLATPGLILTPHAAWYSRESEDGYRREAVDAIRAVLVDGREPGSRVA